MVQRSNDARMQGAKIMFKKEECAFGMGQRSNYAAMKDVQTLPSVEECA